MTTKTQTELERFHQFVGETLQDGNAKLSPEQALALWRERRESVKAIQKALDDMEADDSGRPLDEVVVEIRREIVESDGAERVFYRSQQR